MNPIVRTIQINDLSDLDLSNVGCHWTENVDYIHKGGGQHGTTNRLKYTAKLICTKYQKNEKATEESRKNYPKEREVVLEKNQSLKGRLVIINNDNYSFAFYGFMGIEVEFNTGTRCDAWVEKL